MGEPEAHEQLCKKEGLAAMASPLIFVAPFGGLISNRIADSFQGNFYTFRHVPPNGLY
jgi:hypothetical protein